MICVIAGSRTVLPTIANFLELEYAVLNSGFHITEIVGGDAPGADKIAELFARQYRIPFKPFPAAWRDQDGVKNPGAGFARNEDMAIYAAMNCLDGGGLILLTFKGEMTPGSADMQARAKKRGLATYHHEIDDEEL